MGLSSKLKLLTGVVLLLAALNTSCTSINPLYAGSQRMSMTVLPEYKIYVDNDPDLSPAEKEFRIANIEMFIQTVSHYEENRKTFWDKVKIVIGKILGLIS